MTRPPRYISSAAAKQALVVGIERADALPCLDVVAQLFVHRNARGKVDAVLLLDAARAQQHAGISDLLDIVFVNIAVGGAVSS